MRVVRAALAVPLVHLNPTPLPLLTLEPLLPHARVRACEKEKERRREAGRHTHTHKRRESARETETGRVMRRVVWWVYEA